MNRISIVAFAAITLLFAACGGPEVVDSLKDTDAVNVYLYKSDKTVDRVVDKRVVKRDAAGLKAIISWAKKNSSDWEITTKLFPPVLLIEGKGFSLNVRKDVIVFNGKEGTYIRKTVINDLPWFKQQLGVVDPP